MEKLRLLVKSENPITLEIPNPSDELKKHIADSILNKIHIFNTIEMEGVLPIGEPISFPNLVPTHERPEPIKSVPADKAVQMPEDDKKPNPDSPFAVLKTVVPAKPDVPDHYTTGIKEKDGKKAYKCRYKCTKSTCRQESNHYIWEGTKTVKCHNCDTELTVKKATPEEEMTRDPFGNFYVAGARDPIHIYNKL